MFAYHRTFTVLASAFARDSQSGVGVILQYVFETKIGRRLIANGGSGVYFSRIAASGVIGIFAGSDADGLGADVSLTPKRTLKLSY